MSTPVWLEIAQQHVEQAARDIAAQRARRARSFINSTPTLSVAVFEKLKAEGLKPTLDDLVIRLSAVRAGRIILTANNL